MMPPGPVQSEAGTERGAPAGAAVQHEVRNFDLEADRRSRRFFFFLVIGFALLAIVGGVFAAYMLLEDEPVPTPVANKPKPPPPIEELSTAPQTPWREDESEAPEDPKKPRPAPRLADSVADSELGRVQARLQSAFDACARSHGGVEGTVVQLDFSIGSNGRVSTSATRPPFSSTPLGQCVADAVRSKASFSKTRNGRSDIRWAIRLHP